MRRYRLGLVSMVAARPRVTAVVEFGCLLIELVGDPAQFRCEIRRRSSQYPELRRSLFEKCDIIGYGNHGDLPGRGFVVARFPARRLWPRTPRPKCEAALWPLRSARGASGRASGPRISARTLNSWDF